MTGGQLAQLRALALSVELMRAQIDALLMSSSDAPAAPVNPAETCPKCGAGGDSQVDQSTLDGTKRIFCTSCRTERVL